MSRAIKVPINRRKLARGSELWVGTAHVLHICLTHVEMLHIESIEYSQLPVILTSEQEREIEAQRG